MDITESRKEECLQWLRFVLNPKRDSIPQVRDWQAVYDFAEKQQLIGVCSPAPYPVKEDMGFLFQWFDDEQQIRKLNGMLNKRIKALCGILDQAGFRFCILKGQGNAEMYPDAGLRSPGDIDVWIDGGEEAIIGLVKKLFPNIKQTFKHIKFPVFKDVEVDVHSTPLKLYHPIHNHALKKWITLHQAEQFAHKIKLSSGDVTISVPTARFNVVYQMGHILIHLLDEGIGLRHLVDYYYVLRALESLSEAEKQQITKEWNRMGMLRLATGVMWVEKEILGLPDELLIVKPNAKRGKVLLEEMLEGGNFGHHSSFQKQRNSYFTFRFSKTVRLMRINQLFPGEALFRILHKTKYFVRHIIRF